MKCKICKKRMKSVITNFSIVVDSRKVEIVNVPVEQCPVCGAIWILHLSYKRNVFRRCVGQDKIGISGKVPAGKIHGYDLMTV